MKGYRIIRIAVLSALLFGCRHHDHHGHAPVHVPDSGQTQSYTSVFGQDSDYLLHPPSYSDNGDGTITDNVTGLMWEKGHSATDHLSTGADGYCADLTLADRSDWRPPSDFELMTIADYGATFPSINATYFPDTRSDVHWWTSTQGASSSLTTDRWAMDFGKGNLDTTSLFTTGYTRCVRGGKQPRAFHDSGNGTIIDWMTGLVWQKHEGAAAVWEDAIRVCEESTLGGYPDWRLPNVKELRSIVDSGTYAPAAYTGYFPDTRTDSYWSSTTFAAGPEAAWRVNFWHGEVASSLKVNAHFVRCVRGGE